MQQNEMTFSEENETMNLVEETRVTLQPENNFSPEDSFGNIVVQVVTARGTLPVKDATVTISKRTDGRNEVVSRAVTDADGRTDPVRLPAPKKEDAQSPSALSPFSDYNITVNHPMFYTEDYENVQVFGDEVSLLVSELIPLPEFINKRDSTRTVIIPKQNL